MRRVEAGREQEHERAFEVHRVPESTPIGEADDIKVANPEEVHKCTQAMLKVWAKASPKFKKSNAILWTYIDAMDKVKESLTQGLITHLTRDMCSLATALKVAFPNRKKIENMEEVVKKLQSNIPTAAQAGFPILWTTPAPASVNPQRDDGGGTQLVAVAAPGSTTKTHEADFENARTYFIKHATLLYTMAFEFLDTDVSKWISLAAFEASLASRPSHFLGIVAFDDLIKNMCAYGGNTVIDWTNY